MNAGSLRGTDRGWWWKKWDWETKLWTQWHVLKVNKIEMDMKMNEVMTLPRCDRLEFTSKRNLRWENKLCEMEGALRRVFKMGNVLTWNAALLHKRKVPFSNFGDETTSIDRAYCRLPAGEGKIASVIMHQTTMYSNKEIYIFSQPFFLQNMFVGTLIQGFSQGRNMQYTSRCATSDKFAGAHQLFGWINPAYSTLRHKTKPDGTLSALMFLPPM